jgi:hypothetical protein
MVAANPTGSEPRSEVPLFGATQPTQQSSEKDEAAQSLLAPRLVVVRAPFPAAIAEISDAGSARGPTTRMALSASGFR